MQNMPIGSRCIIMGGAGPPMMNAGYNANYQIVQSPGYVMILTEMIHDAHHPARQPPAGRRRNCAVGRLSRGRWEGNTLVVETTNFNGKNAFRGASENMKVTERFTRVSDDMIDYKFTVEDPATWDRPWTAERRWRRPTGRSSSSPATRRTTASRTSWRARGRGKQKAEQAKKGSN